MANYNPYIDHRTYDSGAYNLSAEKIPTNSSFSCRPEERCLYQTPETVLPLPVILQNIEQGLITELDKKILCLIGTYGFITSKQLHECLTLMHVEVNDNRLKSSLERLKKHQMIHAFKFGTSAENAGNFLTFSLNRNGNELVKVLGISTNYSIMNIAADPWEIKKVLEQNQLMLAYLKSGLSIEWLKRSVLLQSREHKEITLRPSFAIAVEEDVMLYEVVRRGNLWQNYLTNKMERYKHLLDNWEQNSWQIEGKPNLILNGEDKQHNQEIQTLVSELGMEVLFTEDLLLCGESFYHHLYTFTSQGGQQFFGFEKNPADASI